MQKTAQREVEKLNGGGNLQGIWGRGVGGLLSGQELCGAWCHVEMGSQRLVFPAGPWFPRCLTKQGGYQQVFLLRRLVLTETSRGSLIWINPPALYCV